MTEDVLKCRSSEPLLSKHIHEVGGRLGLPVSGTFELTSRCNFSCRMCYIHTAENKKDALSAEQWISLAEEAKKAGLMFLLLTGGEPFLREDFEEIYTAIIKMGIVVSINTNASLYNEKLRELFKKYPPARINISLYGGSDECYKNMCGNAAFERVIENIRQMKADSLNIRLNVSLTPDNHGDMEKICRISQELNLQSKATTYMYPPVRIADSTGENPGRFSANEAGKILARWYSLHDDAERFSDRAKLMVNSEGIAGLENKSICRAGRSSFWITCDGKMLPCGTMGTSPVDLSVYGFTEAWQQTRRFVEDIRLPDKCTVCPMRRYCGVCAAICKDETGSFTVAPEYVCTLTQTMKDEIIRINKEKNHADT